MATYPHSRDPPTPTEEMENLDATGPTRLVDNENIEQIEKNT